MPATADRRLAIRQLVQEQLEQGVLDVGLSIHEAVGRFADRACGSGLISAIVLRGNRAGQMHRRWVVIMRG